MAIETIPPHRSRTKLAAALYSVLFWCGGCSLLLHADASQCSSDTDCTARGPAFANHSCRSGTCVATAMSEAGADATTEAGRETGGLADADADAGDGSDAEAEAGCTIAADCTPTSATHREVACDVESHACVQLTTDTCPYVVGDFSGATAPPVFVGAFATIPPSAPLGHPSYLNYRLAIDEFTSSGGIPAGSGTALRMPVAVICDVAADVHASMVHLQSEVHAPAVVAALDSVSLRTMFVNDAYPKRTFVVNPFGANSTLTSITPLDGLLWHMLGQPSDDAAAYQAFFPRMEAYVRNLQGLGSTPLRVATVTANMATDTVDLADAVTRVIRWNGQSVGQNTPASYLNVGINSVLNGTALGDIVVDTAVTALLNFKPNVIVSFASAEFVKVLQVYEIDLQSAQYAASPKPFYLLGPYNMDSQTLLQWIQIGNSAPSEARRMRVAGIGVASAADTHVLDNYKNRLIGAFNNPAALGQENYYDAMYFAVYSIVGAGHVSPLSGTNLKQGMLRLLSGPSSYDMGPAAMGQIFTVLADPQNSISLFGTLGPPNFTISTGARVGDGSVYCVQRNQDVNLTPGYAYDVLRSTPSTDGGAPSLGGTFSCYRGACGDGGTCSL